MGPMGCRESFPPRFVFQVLDRASERRPRYVTFLSRAAKVRIFADREKIPYLIHFHLVADDSWDNLFAQLLKSEF